MSLPAYAEYKDSGVEWLGDVPKHWQVVSVKRFCDVRDGTHDTPSFVEPSESTYSLVTSKDLSGTGVSFSDTKHISMEDHIEISKRSAVEMHDILMPMIGSIGGAVLVESDREFSIKNIAVFKKSKSLIQKWLLFLLNSELCAVQFSIQRSGGVQGFIALGSLRNLIIPNPPLPEQTTIARFLDHETAKIDALIAEQQRLIELLKEKRQAVISHAVTKGLDPNAPMKDSGVAWLGDVPEHWEVGAIKRFLISLDARRIPLSAEERGGRQGDYPYYGASGIIDTVDDFIFDEDLVLVSEDGANLLSRSTPIAFIARGHFWVNNHAHILKPCDKNLRFWSEQIEHIDLTPFITGSAQPKLTVDALMNLTIPTPPCENERFLISSFIEHETAKIDELISHAHQGIDLLKERRSALISAAVTGKIDVRGWQPPATAVTTPQGQQQILFDD